MNGHKKLLRRMQGLENDQDELLKRIEELECSNHEWTFVGEHFYSVFSGITRYKFKCTKCDKEVTRSEKWLTGTMRPQLELLGYLEPEKKTKKEKS